MCSHNISQISIKAKVYAALSDLNFAQSARKAYSDATREDKNLTMLFQELLNNTLPQYERDLRESMALYLRKKASKLFGNGQSDQLNRIEKLLLASTQSLFELRIATSEIERNIIYMQQIVTLVKAQNYSEPAGHSSAQAIILSRSLDAQTSSINAPSQRAAEPVALPLSFPLSMIQLLHRLLNPQIKLVL
ncbi:MAG: hypothetical protein LLG04_09795 [Parachlamydia sp.]|nr:hypothetical protein [Parachlamydia sp.]